MLTRIAHDSYTPGMKQILYGHLEEGERPEASVVRELHEETGLVPIALYHLNETFLFYDPSEFCMQICPVFVATIAEESTVELDLSEHESFDWVPFSHVREQLPWPAQRRAFDTLNELLGRGDLPQIMKINIT